MATWYYTIGWVLSLPLPWKASQHGERELVVQWTTDRSCTVSYSLHLLCPGATACVDVGRRVRCRDASPCKVILRVYAHQGLTLYSYFWKEKPPKLT